MWNIETFIKSLEHDGLKERTIDAYKRHVDRFITWCDEHKIESARYVTEAVVNRYVETCIDRRDVTPSWKYAEKLALNRYFAVLENHDVILIAPVIHARKPKVRTGRYRAIDREKLRDILDTFPTETASDILAKSILETGYSAALRPSELRNLKIEDIEFSQGQLFLSQAKGAKDRIVPIGKMAMYWLKRYIADVRPRYVTDPAERHVYVGPRTKKKFRHRSIGELIRYRLAKHGYSHFSLHQLRSSAATHMVESGLDSAYVQRILGHTEIKTTQGYVQIQLRELAARLADAHPRIHLAETQ